MLLQILSQTAAWFLLIFSVAGLAIGLALLTRSAGTLAFFAFMNRWVSTGRALEALEAPRRMQPTSRREGRWMGAIFIAFGAYSLVVLLAGIDAAKLAEAFRLAHSPLAAVVIRTLRWLLVAGCIAAVAGGVLLLFLPGAWSACESRADRWYWSRQLATNGDRMHLALDRVVAAFPRACGGLLIALSLVSTASCALLLLRR